MKRNRNNTHDDYQGFSRSAIRTIKQSAPDAVPDARERKRLALEDLQRQKAKSDARTAAIAAAAEAAVDAIALIPAPAAITVTAPAVTPVVVVPPKRIETMEERAARLNNLESARIAKIVEMPLTSEEIFLAETYAKQSTRHDMLEKQVQEKVISGIVEIEIDERCNGLYSESRNAGFDKWSTLQRIANIKHRSNKVMEYAQSLINQD